MSRRTVGLCARAAARPVSADSSPRSRGVPIPLLFFLFAAALLCLLAILVPLPVPGTPSPILSPVHAPLRPPVHAPVLPPVSRPTHLPRSSSLSHSVSSPPRAKILVRVSIQRKAPAQDVLGAIGQQVAEQEWPEPEVGQPCHPLAKRVAGDCRCNPVLDHCPALP